MVLDFDCYCSGSLLVYRCAEMRHSPRSAIVSSRLHLRLRLVEGDRWLVVPRSVELVNRAVSDAVYYWHFRA